jgi:TfoX/Sxy family transcriptional regulator of competence genes
MDPDFIVELFAPFGSVTVRRMFGGAGLFREGLMFGLVFDGAGIFGSRKELRKRAKEMDHFDGSPTLIPCGVRSVTPPTS